MMLALCSGLLTNLVKIMEVGKGRRELVPWLGSMPASVLEALPVPVNLNWYSVI